MGKTNVFATILLCTPLVAGCSAAPTDGSGGQSDHGSAEPPAVPGVPSPAHMLDVWIQETPDLPAPDAIDGCNEWWMEGVACERNYDWETADIRVVADTNPCIRDPKTGRLIFATSYDKGYIVFAVRCLGHAQDGALDIHQFRTVMAHETGHELGIWNHVPKDCDGAAVVHPSGEAVCGPALMNPNYNPEVDDPTKKDGLAFDLRSIGDSVLNPKNRTPIHTLAELAALGAARCQYTDK